MSSRTAKTTWITLASLLALAACVVLALSWTGGTAPRAGAGPSSSADASGAPADPSSGAPSGAPTGSAAPSADPSGGGASPAPDPTRDPTPTGPASGYREVTPEPPIPLTSTADFGTGLTLAVTAVDEVRGEARGPGQVDAPAVRLRLRAENGSGRPIDLSTMTITVTYGPDRTPASELAEPGGSPFGGRLAAGDSATAAYVFAVPPESRGTVHVTASYTGDAPMVVFAGAAS